MAFDKSTRNRLQNFVSQARSILSEEFIRQLQSTYGIDPKTGSVSDVDSLSHLDNRQRQTAQSLRETLAYYSANTPGKSSADRTRQLLERIVREQAFTVLNRLAALRMAESRGFLLESIGKGYLSKGFQLYKQLAGSSLGEMGDAYRNYLFSLFDEFSLDLAVLFDRYSIQGLLFPRKSALLELLDEIDHPEIEPLWAEDETIGWIYQYYNDPAERKTMREQSAAPRNSRELAVRNQFFTPRYVVEFLTDNTLGRIWYEMTKGRTRLTEQCRYLVRRPTEIFLAEGETIPQTPDQEGLSQEELLKQPVYIIHRPLKDPREIRLLDPACGSMHFGLYAFDLFETIYEEAWDNGFCTALQKTYLSKDEFLKDVPRLIIEHNIHGIDIDPRAVQIAGLSLWLRAQKAWHSQGVKPVERPRVRRSNIVCAEPMPGNPEMLEEFIVSLKQPILGELVKTVFDKMQLAGEAGSLLKIEEEIRTAIDTARKAWDKLKAKPLELFSTEELNKFSSAPELTGLEQALVSDLRPLTTDFWDTAEQQVIDALRAYAEQADVDSSQRRLFADDAARGFAFIDLCRKRYDAVVMNPPFGLATEIVFEQLRRDFPDTFVELYASFVHRSLGLASAGFVGAISSRGFFSMTRLTRWRRNDFVANACLVLDLGLNVMDNAFVASCSYILGNGAKTAPILVLDTMSSDSRDELGEAQNWSSSTLLEDGRLFIRDRSHFLKIPEAKFIYRATPDLVGLFDYCPAFEGTGGEVRTGLTTFDDTRFLRLVWELPQKFIGQDKMWQYFSKGGDYARYYTDIHLAINRADDGKELAEVNRKLNGQVAQSRQGSSYYYRPGLTFTSRSGRGFSVRALPAGCVISHNAPTIYPASEIASSYLLGWMNARLILELIGMQASADYFTPGSVKVVPWKAPAATAQQAVEKLVSDLTHRYGFLSSSDETSLNFASLPTSNTSLCGAHVATERALIGLKTTITTLQASVSDAIDEVYGVNSLALKSELLESDPDADVPLPVLDLAKAADDLVSYLIGTAYGRWDIRYATGKRQPPELPDPFDPLPVCPPGMLQNAEGLPAEPKDVPSDYPLRIAWPGILVDDENHPEDVVARVREAIEAMWKDRAEAIEQEACDILGVRTLRDYLSKPAKFFAEHLKCYSKSRRQAPIYWPLSTESGSYTLWIYYHRLDSQTLYSCVNNFVEPKLEQISSTLVSLRSKSARSSREDKELEQLSDLEAELKDFRDELLRIAKFWKPNLNDGVQITAAPLWKLFGHKTWQKTLKETWGSLEKEEYDWAHLACTIWPERVLRKCHKDRSLAIAHDVEDDFWHEMEVPLKRGKKTTVEIKTEWQPKPLSNTELDALIQTKIAEMKR